MMQITYPQTTGNDNQKSYKKIDGFVEQAGEGNTGGSITIFIDSLANFSQTFVIPEYTYEKPKLFEIEIAYFNQLIKDGKFLEENQGKYIAIRNNEILGKDSNFSSLAKKVYEDRNNIGKVLIRMISDKEEIIHLDSPVY